MYLSKEDYNVISEWADKYPSMRIAQILVKLDKQRQADNAKTRVAMANGRKINKKYGQINNPDAIKRPRRKEVI